MPILNRLRILRDRAALSQRELAAEAGVTPLTVLNLERGATARPSTMRKLAAALKVKPAELLDEEVKV